MSDENIPECPECHKNNGVCWQYGIWFCGDCDLCFSGEDEE